MSKKLHVVMRVHGGGESFGGYESPTADVVGIFTDEEACEEFQEKLWWYEREFDAEICTNMVSLDDKRVLVSVWMWTEEGEHIWSVRDDLRIPWPPNEAEGVLSTTNHYNTPRVVIGAKITVELQDTKEATIQRAEEILIKHLGGQK